MQVSEVFELEKVCDNPLFEGIGCGDAPSLLGRQNLHSDFFPVVRANWNWEAERLSPFWEVPKLAGRVRAFNDYPCLNMMIPAFSHKAVEVLREFLEPNGELLPVVHEVVDGYFLYNCSKIVEIFNWHGKKPNTSFQIRYFDLLPERLQGLTIFRMREDCMRTFVTNTFADRVRQAGLNGFHFIKAWPLPPNTDYQMIEAIRRREQGQAAKTSYGLVEAKRQSMVIAFPLAESKLTKEEKRMISYYEDELDAQLLVSRLDDNYFGSLEMKKTAKGVSRLYLSCPDHGLLLEKLGPWLKRLVWKEPVQVYVRDEPYDDYKCAEHAIDVKALP